MAIDKDFVIKSGLQVNENLIYADPDTDKVGVGTTTADKRLVVIGDQETSASLSVGTTITAQRLVTSGFTTAIGGIAVGVAGTIFNTTYNALDINGPGVGINSSDPRYTLEVIGPVSIGDTAQFIYGDLTVTGDISGSSLSGQISAGGTVGFTNVTVEKNLDANNAEVYTLFRLQEFSGDRFRFLSAGDPPGIGFTQNVDDPEIYLVRGQHYQFDVDSGGFPFYIKRQPTADLNNLYNDGVENNGIQVGIVTFKVPFNAPNELYYQASNTAGMGGTIYITNDGRNINVGVATITEYINATTAQADFLNIYVSGIGTIQNLKGPDFSVSAGILTVRQDQTALIGVSTGTDAISVQEKSDNVSYQVPFTPTLGIGSNYQNIFVDSEDGQMSYNPSTNVLTVNRVVGNVSGIATGADNINIDSSNSATNFQVTFSDPGTYGYERQYIDSESGRFIYNPSTNTLSAKNIIATTVTAGLAGTATRADFINVDANSNSTNYQIVFSDPGGTNYQRLYIDGTSTDFTYNPSSNTFTATNIAGAGDNITNLNATNLSQGTVNNNRLIKSSTSVQGIVQLSNAINGTSQTIAASEKAVGDLKIHANNASNLSNGTVNPARLPSATLSVQGAVILSNSITSNSQTTAATSKAVSDLKTFAAIASNLTSGTVNPARLPAATNSVQGAVIPINTYPPVSNSTVQPPSADAFRRLYQGTINIIPTGTRMLFYQGSAPTGWTKITSQNNKALRVVSGTGGLTGGSNSFTSTFSSNRVVPVPFHDHPATSGANTGNHTHGANANGNNQSHSHGGGANVNGLHGHSYRDPGHSHSYYAKTGDVEYGDRGSNAASRNDQGRNTDNRGTGISINSDGNHSHSLSITPNGTGHFHGVTIDQNGAGHTHSLSVASAGSSGAAMNFDVQYIDVIIASKNAP